MDTLKERRPSEVEIKHFGSSLKGRYSTMGLVTHKLDTLASNPIGVLQKYRMRALKSLLRINFDPRFPIYGEDYDLHWNYCDFNNKSVLDLGADYGSTAAYFLKLGARHVTAIEANELYFSKLAKNFRNYPQVECFHLYVESFKDIEALALDHSFDIVKVDIEGNECCLVGEDLHKVAKTWLVETHNDTLRSTLQTSLSSSGFHVRAVPYGKLLKKRNENIGVLVAKYSGPDYQLLNTVHVPDAVLQAPQMRKARREHL